MKVAISTVLLLVFAASDARSGTVEVCIEKYAGNQNDYAALFNDGPIIVPSGTVFNYAGHSFGPPSDPLDKEHMGEDSADMWPSLSQDERQRRSELLTKDMDIANEEKEAVATSEPLVLSRHRNCASTTGEVVISDSFQWSPVTIIGDKNIYYQAYGVISSGMLDTTFKGNTPFDFAAQSGQLNAVVHGSITSSIRIQ